MIARSDGRLKASAGTTPALDIRFTKAGLAPKKVTSQSWATRHSASGPGYAGLPSYSTGRTPSSSELTRKFHIIQPVVVKKNIRSPGRRSMCRCCSFICSSRIPPWLCTIALGSPVVPEENRTHSGWPNGTCSTAYSAAPTPGWSSSSSQAARAVHSASLARPRHADDQRRPGQPGDDLAQLAAAAELLAAVAVAAGAEQNLRLQLPEPVQRPPPAVVGRAAGPDRADADGGQHRDDRLRDVRQVGRHPVPRPHAQVPQPGAEDPHRAAQLGPVHGGGRRGLAGVQQGGLAGPLAAQHVVRVVQPGAGKPVGAGHAPVAEDPVRRDRGLDLAVVPDRLPEPVEVRHGPAPQLGVAVEAQAAFGGQPGAERGQVGLRHPLRAGRPEQVALAHRSRHRSPSRRAAFSLRIFGRTSGLIGSASKSASQRSGVSSG